MRPVHVVVLLLSGALAGAVIMKVAHRGRPAIPVAEAQPVAPPATAPPEAAAPAPAIPVAAVPAPASAVPAAVDPEPKKPSPMPPAAPRSAPRPVSKPSRPRVPVTLAVVGVVAPKPEPVAPPPALPAAPPPLPAEPAPLTPVPQPHQVTLNAGSILPVRLVGGLSSGRNAAGDVFAATLDQSLVANGFVVAPRGARVEGRVVAVEQAHARSAPAIALELIRLTIADGQTASIQTDACFQHGARGGFNSGTMVDGSPFEMPPQTMMTFRLKSPIQLTEVR